MLKASVEELRAELEESRSGGRERAAEVLADDIAEVVSRRTGIPVAQLTQEERERLLGLEEQMHERMVGQDEAVEAVARAVRRARAGLGDPNRPVGSFLFLGPTGVGKTELARALAETLFGDEDAMVRFDMSEFQERHTVSRLVGAPPGYVGYEDAGQLTETVRRRPYSVLLLDEIEKAHPDVFNILLQLLEDGRLTDGQGRTVDFRHTVVIMTSNLGADRIQAHARRDESFEQLKDELMEMLRQSFTPGAAQPDRRDHRVPLARPRSAGADHTAAAGAGGTAHARPGRGTGGVGRGGGVPGERRVRPPVRGAPAAESHPAAVGGRALGTAARGRDRARPARAGRPRDGRLNVETVPEAEAVGEESETGARA